MFATFAKAIVCLALGQSPGDVVFSNSRAQRVEANFPESRRAEIRELLLYASLDQGLSWDQISKILPDQKAFEFSVPNDGAYWLRVAAINRNGEQEPKSLFKVQPNWKMVIDTLKPIARFASVTRNSNEVSVNWEILEAHPEWSTFRLEYMPAPSGQATPINATPGLTGSARFTPNTNGPVVVRLFLRDKAGNESIVTADVTGREGFVPNPIPSTAPNAAPPSVAQQPPTLPNVITPPVSTSFENSTAFAPPPISNPPLPLASIPETLSSPPSFDQGNVMMPGHTSTKTQTVAERPTRPFTQPAQLAPVDGSRWQSPNAAPPPPVERPITIANTASTIQPTIQQVQYQPNVPATPRKPLPPLQYVNSPEVVLEYELSKVGPSGVGRVDIYLTHDDGQAWEHVASDDRVVGKTIGGRHQGIVELPGDGIYGFSLMVKSQAQKRQEDMNFDKKGKGPRGGELPEIRVEVDTVPPTAELFAPRRDTAKTNSLMLSWTAADKNLGTNPVTLEWAERREGPWSPIANNIANTGKHSWQLPDRLPVEVYMRLRVKDLAGNEGVAVTPDPQLVDLSEPEGRLVNVTVPPRR